MPKLTLIFATALIALGLIAFFATGMRHPTALIPAYVGIVLLALGVLALRPSLRKHAMHGVAVVALLATLAALGRLIPALVKGTGTPWSIGSLVAMAILCGTLEALCVQSFIAARRARLST